MKPSALSTIILFCFSCSSVPCTLTQSLPDQYWEDAEWISAADAPVIEGKVKSNENCRAADGASWFLTTVTNDKKVKSAKWMTASLGINELYLNGQRIGEEVLKPGFTHPSKTKISYTYDITAAINRGKGARNTFAIQLTPGWWADKITTPSGHDGMLGHKCALRSVIEITYSDGTRKVVGTDRTHWIAGIAGPVKHAAIFDGEKYDAREPQGFDTPEKLSTPELNTEFSGEIVPTDGAEVYRRVDLSLCPVEAYSWKDIEGADGEHYGKVVKINSFSGGQEMLLGEGETLVVDFGQNCSGVPEFDFKAAEGVTLTCLPAEILNDGNGAHSRGMDGPEGSCHRTNLRIPDQGMSLDYTFAGNPGGEHYSPRCTFFGYRYVSITATGPVSILKLSSVPITSIAKRMETGRIITGSEPVNRLISNTMWGQRSNYLSVSTDCPQRNERLGWTADTQVFTETGSFFANTDRFFHKWMRDMRDSQSETGAFPGVAPTAQYGDPMMRVGWADAGIIVPWTIWKQFGDTAIIEENWDSMQHFLTHVSETRYDHAAVTSECQNYQWADWLSFEALESHKPDAIIKDASGKRTPTPDAIAYWNYLGASYWAIDALMMRDMALATGRDSTPFEALAREAKDYIRETFVLPDGSFVCEVLNTMQTPALFALKNGIFEGQARENLIERLRENFKLHDGCLQTGFLGTSILMNTLTENGMTDIAYDLLFQRKNPSWLYSVDNGATTIWERWNSYTIENGMGPKGMNSFNHYAYGCVCEWLWKTACGIAADVKAPGFRHIIMKPVPDKRLGFVKASFDSPAGRIVSEWKYENDKWIWEFEIPKGVSASVTLPGESTPVEYQSGRHTVCR